jgi:parallel beta-helix repeat protein
MRGAARQTCAAIALVCLGCAGQAIAADIHVYPGGRIQDGVNRATSPGDVVIVHGGTYDEDSGNHDCEGICIAHSGTSGNPITLKSAPGETATTRRVTIQSEVRHYVIDGLRFVPGGRYYTAIQLQDSGQITVQGVEIDGGNDGTIDLGMIGCTSGGCVFRQNHIHDIGMHGSCPTSQGQSGCYGLYVMGNDLLIEQNHIHHIGNYCIHGPYTSGGTWRNATVRGNIVHHCGSDPNFNFGDGILATGIGHKYYNNVVYDTRAAGLSLLACQDCEVYNNTIMDNGVGLYIREDSRGITAKNNLLYRNGANVSNDSGGATLVNNVMSAGGP